MGFQGLINKLNLGGTTKSAEHNKEGKKCSWEGKLGQKPKKIAFRTLYWPEMPSISITSCLLSLEMFSCFFDLVLL